MQAVIMAGGKGTRLKSITNDEIPKPMVSVAGKPLLQWQVETLKENGVTDAIIVVGHLGDKIIDYFGDGQKFGISISYYIENTPLGTAGALGIIKDRLESTFILVFGDVIFNVDINRMYRFHESHKSSITLFTHPNSHPYDSDLVITNEDGRVIDFCYKNAEREDYYQNLVNAGFYLVEKKICNDILKGTKTDLEKEVITNRVNSSKDVYAYRSTEYIKDAGTPERIVSVEKDIERGIVKNRNLKNMQKCIFLDRDGTINKYKGLVYRCQDFELEDGVSEAIKLINNSGWLGMVVTNQPVVARGLCDIEDVKRIHMKMEALLGENGAYLDDIAFCPHHPDKGYPEENPKYKIKCRCRKPQIGLLEKLSEKYNIDLSQSWFVGDSTVDIQTGLNAGMHTALVKTGVAGSDGKYAVKPEIEVCNLEEIVELICIRKE